MKQNIFCLAFLTFSVWLGLGGAPARATMLDLTDANSSVQMNLDGSSGGTLGLFSWTVDGTDQLAQQWFFYRLGPSGPQNPINALGSPVISNSTPSVATVTYAGSNGLAIAITFTLQGGDPLSGTSDLSEQVKITNTSGGTQAVHFFQYSNFDLDNLANQDNVQFLNIFGVDQTSNNNSEYLSESVASPSPNEREADYYPNTLNRLTTTNGYTLNQANSNADSPSAVVGPGDVTWAYEWDKTIKNNSDFQISKDMNLTGVTPTLVPEPSTFLLASVGLFALFGLIRRRAMGSR